MDYPLPLPKLDEVSCSECRREASVDVAEHEGWGCWWGIDGELYAFCVQCFESEFGGG